MSLRTDAGFGISERKCVKIKKTEILNDQFTLLTVSAPCLSSVSTVSRYYFPSEVHIAKWIQFCPHHSLCTIWSMQAMLEMAHIISFRTVR